ncbi:MAG: hypothetical protein ACO2PM_04540 [Pyrobaculum sp.]
MPPWPAGVPQPDEEVSSALSAPEHGGAPSAQRAESTWPHRHKPKKTAEYALDLGLVPSDTNNPSVKTRLNSLFEMLHDVL